MTSSSAGIEARLKTSENSLKDAKEKINQLESLTASQSDRIIVYQEKQTAYETERRKLHNTILELKGNIRVFCRVRPLLPDKDANKSGSNSFDYNIPHIAFTGDKTMDIVRSAGKYHDHWNMIYLLPFYDIQTPISFIISCVSIISF